MSFGESLNEGIGELQRRRTPDLTGELHLASNQALIGTNRPAKQRVRNINWKIAQWDWGREKGESKPEGKKQANFGFRGFGDSLEGFLWAKIDLHGLEGLAKIPGISHQIDEDQRSVDIALIGYN